MRGSGAFGQRPRPPSAADPDSHRRSLGLPWLIGLVVIPLLIAAIGYGAFERPRSAERRRPALPTLDRRIRPVLPQLSLAPLSISRNGNDITLSGDFPDDSAKAALMKVLKNSLPAGVNIIDQIHTQSQYRRTRFLERGTGFQGQRVDYRLQSHGQR